MRNTITNNELAVIFCFGLVVFFTLNPELALAAAPSDSWATQPNALLTVLKSGLTKMGSAVLGVGIMAIGIFNALSGRFDFMQLASFIGAGLLVAFGPTIIEAMFGLTSSTTAS